MAPLKLVHRDERPPAGPPSRSAPARRVPPLPRIVALASFLVLLACLLSALGFLVWWWANEDTREIQALPEEQRIPLYRRTMDNLANICDPAATRALRDFCHGEADRALRFRECDADPRCQELARRHLPQPHR